MAISQAWRPSGVFQNFQHPWSTVCITDKKGSRSIAPLGAKLWPFKEGKSQRNFAKFDRYYSSMFKDSFLPDNYTPKNQTSGLEWWFLEIQGAKLLPFKGSKAVVIGFFSGGYSEYLSWHVAKTISSLTAILLINRCPPPVLGHHPLLVFSC